ncbi:MAG: hypothetical protein Q9216_004346 [Gyalolechia sp. 2 TL-2023]
MPPKTPRSHGRPRGRPKKAGARLPPIEGPKLHQFADFDADIEFVQLLTDPESDTSAHVFEVIIAARSYALKIFKHYDKEEDDQTLWGSQRDKAPLDELEYYFDPFYNECRAYGQLVEANLNGEVAVRCHGYMILPIPFKHQLKKKFGVNGWDQPTDLPLRAIVKDFAPEDTTWTPAVARKMLKDLKRMRKANVYAMDVKPENYKKGLLVDFSIALTKPHFVFDVKPEHQVRGYMKEDLILFDDMMREKNVKTRIRASRNEDTMKKLRSYGKRDDEDDLS